MFPFLVSGTLSWWEMRERINLSTEGEIKIFGTKRGPKLLGVHNGPRSELRRDNAVLENITFASCHSRPAIALCFRTALWNISPQQTSCELTAERATAVSLSLRAGLAGAGLFEDTSWTRLLQLEDHRSPPESKVITTPRLSPQVNGRHWEEDWKCHGFYRNG